jgi:hypothetical protein
MEYIKKFIYKVKLKLQYKLLQQNIYVSTVKINKNLFSKLNSNHNINYCNKIFI